MECNSCGGSGYLPCNRCSGSGRMTCFKCEGSGYIETMEIFGDRPSNKYFGGRGSRPCHKCEEMGTLPCLKCDETGSVSCRKCDGTGIYDPPHRERTKSSSSHGLGREAEVRVTGIVKFFNLEKGFGFITLDSGVVLVEPG
jgi:RecJ-like exonuclease